MKMFLTSILLYAAVTLISFGINTNNPIIAFIGGFLAGIYNTMISYKQD